jgi:hypothetical protein
MTDSPTHQPGVRTQTGEIIASGQRYAVTRDGLPDINAADLMFIAPEHQWRTVWSPEAAATVSLTREDHAGGSAAWLAPLGLLGLAVHAVGGRFRTVSATEFQAAADEITDQMSRYIPDTWATVVLPAGFTLYTVSPAMVVGSVQTHAQLLLADGQQRPDR